MKIQCDVCNKDEASVYCSADEAALCAACDHRVHHANKLAGKHHRLSLLLPSPTQFPLCDICQEKRAFLFCQQDRAILCRDCDLPIHKANEHTQKHNRFLLTGVKLSPTSALYSPPPSSSVSNNGFDVVPDLKSQNSAPPTKPNPPTTVKPPALEATTNKGFGYNQIATSSISEYLIETLPGWRVEDFLDSVPPSGFSKTIHDNLPIWDTDLENNLGSYSSSRENIGIWVPQTPPSLCSPHYPSSDLVFSNQISFDKSKETTNKRSSRDWRDDGNCFAVPQISPPSTASKRSRTLW